MAADSFHHSVQMRVQRVADELTAINVQIFANLLVLPGKRELVDQLIRRCDELSSELGDIRAELYG